MDQRDRLRDHRSHRRPSPAPPPCRMDPRALAHREQAPLGPGRDLRRGPLPDPHRPRTTSDGQPAEPGHQRTTPGRPHQHCPRQPALRKPTRPTSHTTADQLKHTATSREADFAGALATAPRDAHYRIFYSSPTSHRLALPIATISIIAPHTKVNGRCHLEAVTVIPRVPIRTKSR